MIFDELGNVDKDASGKVLDTTDKISDLVDNLFKELFAKGMTVVESRALTQMLIATVSAAGSINIVTRQCEQWEDKKSC